MLCQQCNFSNPKDAVFCGMCGIKILIKELASKTVPLTSKKRRELAKQLIIQQKQ